MDFDVLIAGAGPAGLCLARSLSGAGLRIGVVDPQPSDALANPAFDGREIALSQHSTQTLRRLGLWERIEAEHPSAFAPLRDARVMDNAGPFSMLISHQLTARSELGWFCSNHRIRRAAWQAVQDSMAEHGDISLLLSDSVVGRQPLDGARMQVQLKSGAAPTTRLLVAADSRFSPTRRALGIGASQTDFGRTMLVFEAAHELPHEHVALEWFGLGQTRALLPMNDDPDTGAHRASVVLTLPQQQIEALQALDDEAFSADITRRFEQRLGQMRVISTRHAYPLVGVYPHRLVTERFACVGDAAVGMHPVTAHGFNFGLLSVENLSRQLLAAQRANRDIGSLDVLRRYQLRQRLATRPLYEATGLVARLYTTDSGPARLLRSAALGLAGRLPPFKWAIASSLAGR